MEKILPAVRKGLQEAAEIVQDIAVDLAYDARDAVQSGLGVPKLISSIASLSVAAVAAAGTASLTLNIASKFLVKRDCKTCNGWEGLRCTTCVGTGEVQYHFNKFGLQREDDVTIESLAQALKDGKAEIGHIPASFDVGLPLPRKKCPSCDGTGVMKCTDCKGDAWKLKLNCEDVMDVPWKAQKIYGKLDPPYEQVREDLKDPTSAAFWLFGRPELERGIKFDDDVKQKIWWKYKDWRQNELLREAIANREPGWEAMQEVLAAENPALAMQDPIIVKNIPYYKARKQVEAEVSLLEVPPRPSNWGGLDAPLKESDWSEEDLRNPRRRAEMDTLLQAQQNVLEGLLNSAWEQKWRQEKVEEVIKEKVESYVPQDEHGKTPFKVRVKEKVERPTGDKSVEPPGKIKQATPQGKAGKTKVSEEDRKKKARQERAERLARQAAEREAALTRAKAAKQSSG
ncbi:hypothetical protein O6H91_03G074000 [Diphasiastrum complanatum]|uniref:Uncharacterized protein n=1 Tax=Diphasiastrum complanatum TaxID=34168 RepID=A0ACC2E871_DIPCM|nr:hypothetical protein O6H91_03G074000 [Diphasiastrum complanatum]